MKSLLFVLLWTLVASFSCHAIADAMSDFEAEVQRQKQKTICEELQAKAPEETQAIADPADRMKYEHSVLVEENKVKEAIALCILAFVSLVAVLYFLTKHESHPGPYIVNATALIFIIFGTITLVVIAQTEEQLTAAIGILGGVAGYLFGSMRRKEGASEEPGEGKAP